MINYKTIAAVVMVLLLFGCGMTAKQKNQATSHYTLGLSHLQSGSPTMALKELIQAEKIDPDDAEIQALLAQIYQIKKAYPKAEEHYQLALKLSDNDPRFQNNLAALYLSMEQWDKAIDYFSKAAENLLFMRTELALTGIGYAHFRKGDFPAAINAYQDAKSIAPGYALISLRLGEVYYALGQDAAARNEFETALSQSPANAEAHYRLGLVLLREKKNNKAVEMFRRVLELSPESEWGQKSASFLKTTPF
ncbi:MAG TPA: tetratricopeptide repeat protein [Geopsychrobacteraceae bacterium]|nr:tetratricopeptide repeat protein [Geopsychrobacteraceae bacterium]